MVSIKDLYDSNGEINEEILDVFTVLVGGLGVRKDGTEAQRKRSAQAARHIAAMYAKHVMERERLDQQLLAAQQGKQH